MNGLTLSNILLMVVLVKCIKLNEKEVLLENEIMKRESEKEVKNEKKTI